MGKVITEDEINQKIQELAETIYQENSQSDSMVFIGLDMVGRVLAERILSCIGNRYQNKPKLGHLDVSLFKSIKSNENFVSIGQSDISFSMRNKTVVLVSDQVNSGKTMVAALNALSDYDEPDSIKCCSLIDRQSLKRPILFDYIGFKFSVKNYANVDCKLYEIDGEDSIKLTLL